MAQWHCTSQPAGVCSHWAPPDSHLTIRGVTLMTSQAQLTGRGGTDREGWGRAGRLGLWPTWSQKTGPSRASARDLELLAGILSVPLSSFTSDAIRDLLHCPKGARQRATHTWSYPSRQLSALCRIQTSESANHPEAYLCWSP